jgi:hypothetical protein
MKLFESNLERIFYFGNYFVIKKLLFQYKKTVLKSIKTVFLLFTQTLQVTEFTIFSAKAKVNR